MMEDNNTENDKIQADCTCKGELENNNDPCGNFQLSLNNGKLMVSNLNAPIEIIDLFSENWQPIYNCTADCKEPTIIEGLSRGKYHIIIKSYTTDWKFICRKTITFKITESGVEIVNNSRSNFREDQAFIFPNPATNKVNIKLVDFVGTKAQIQVLNYLGKEMHHLQLDKIPVEMITINSSDWANGIYLVQIKLENRPIITKKLVINRLY